MSLQAAPTVGGEADSGLPPCSRTGDRAAGSEICFGAVVGTVHPVAESAVGAVLSALSILKETCRLAPWSLVSAPRRPAPALAHHAPRCAKPRQK